MTNSIFDIARNANMSLVLQSHYNYAMAKPGRYDCPDCKGKEDFEVYEHAAKCFKGACGYDKPRNPIDFIVAKDGIEPIEAVKIIYKIIGKEMPKSDKAEDYHGIKGFSRIWHENKKLSQIPIDSNFWQYFLTERMISSDTLTYASQHIACLEVKQGRQNQRMMFYFSNEKGQGGGKQYIMDGTKVKIDTDGDKIKHDWKNAGVKNKYFKATEGKQVVYCEGIEDAFALADMYYDIEVRAVGGITNFMQDIPAGESVVLALDNDGKGMPPTAKAMALACIEADKLVYVWNSNTGKDANDKLIAIKQTSQAIVKKDITDDCVSYDKPKMQQMIKETLEAKIAESSYVEYSILDYVFEAQSNKFIHMPTLDSCNQSEFNMAHKPQAEEIQRIIALHTGAGTLRKSDLITASNLFLLPNMKHYFKSCRRVKYNPIEFYKANDINELIRKPKKDWINTIDRFYKDDGFTYFNSYLHGGVIITKSHRNIDLKPFDDLLNFLTQGMDSHKTKNELLNWMSHLLQKRGEKIGIMPIITGGSGIGKSTIMEILEASLGKEHCSQPDQMVATEHYTGWCNNYLLASLNDYLNVGDKLDRCGLATMITDKGKQDRKMYSDSTNTGDSDYINFHMNSNIRNCITIKTDTERRMLMIAAPLLMKLPESIKAGLRNPETGLMLEENIGAITRFLMQRDISDYQPLYDGAYKTEEFYIRCSSSKTPVGETILYAVEEGLINDLTTPRQVKFRLEDQLPHNISHKMINNVCMDDLGYATIKSQNRKDGRFSITLDQHATAETVIVTQNIAYWNALVFYYMKQGDPAGLKRIIQDEVKRAISERLDDRTQFIRANIIMPNKEHEVSNELLSH